MPLTRTKVLCFVLWAVVACGDDDGAPGPDVDACGCTQDAGSDAALDAAMMSQGITDEELFAEDAPIWHFDLEMTPTDLAWLNTHAVDEMYRPGNLVFQQQRYENVAIRYKGGFGSLQGCFDADGNLICSKLSLKVSFNETDANGRFAGLRKLIFHACNRDRTCLRERVSYGLYRDMGVETSRAGHATVSINGGPPQLYALIEYIDKEFVQDHFVDGSGNLYKEVWPTSTSADGYIANLQTNETAPNVSHIVDFAQVMSTTTLATYDANVAPFLDLGLMGRYTAVDQLINNWDGIWKFYCATVDACGNHNFYVYDDPTSGRFSIIPWDVDNTFTEPFPDMGRSFHDDGPNVCELTPLQIPGIMIAGTRNPQCDPVMQGIYQGAGWERYRTALRQLLSGEKTSQAAVLARLNRYRARVRETVTDDPSALPLDEWDGAVAALRQIIIAQYSNAQVLVDEP
jgi:hypothetical protein